MHTRAKQNNKGLRGVCCRGLPPWCCKALRQGYIPTVGPAAAAAAAARALRRGAETCREAWGSVQ